MYLSSVSSHMQSALHRIADLTRSLTKPPTPPAPTGPTHPTDHVENCRPTSTTVKPSPSGQPPPPANNSLLGKIAWEIVKTLGIDALIEGGVVVGKAAGNLLAPGPSPTPQPGGSQGASGNPGAGGSGGSGAGGSSGGGGAQGSHG
jgi:hypothetical protein